VLRYLQRALLVDVTPGGNFDTTVAPVLCLVTRSYFNSVAESEPNHFGGAEAVTRCGCGSKAEI
jgi:hypothetical protein